MDDATMDREVDTWMSTLRRSELEDPVWKVRAYAIARYALVITGADVRGLAGTQKAIADQLNRAVGSISANLGEGYGRPTLADRSRFYSYALGSIREAISWYASIEGSLGAEAVGDRIDILSRIRRLTFGLLKATQRAKGRPTFERRPPPASP
jgi:four helix bundle protein